MKIRLNIFRRSRTLVALLILSLPLVFGGCPLGYPVQCSQGVTFTLERGKCTLINSPCDILGSWEEGDSFTLDFSAASSGTSAPTPDVFIDERTSSSGTPSRTTTLRRLCSPPFGSTLDNVLGRFEYARSQLAGSETFRLTVFDEGILTVQAKVHCPYCPYLRSGEQLKIKADTSGGVPPYTYTFTANGDPIPPVSTNLPSVPHSPTQNTEYKVTVTDGTNQQATTTVLVNVTNAPNSPVAVTNAPTCGTINTPTTINPSSITGNIVRWQWDKDWHGDDGEPFETTIEGSNGSITMTWTTTGTKYVRLRVTDAQGNFNEIFVAVRVDSVMCRSEKSVAQEN